MSLSSEAIDRIVANVLKQISPASPVAAATSTPAAVKKLAAPAGAMSLSGSVITASLVESVQPGSVITVAPKAIVTPAAWDVVRAQRIQIQRGSVSGENGTGQATVSNGNSQQAKVPSLLIVVSSSNVVDQLWEAIASQWKRELLGCPDDAAKLAISELTRGGTGQVVILAEQTHRAACLANRNEQVKAVAIQDAGDIKSVRKQIRANVWCLDPSRRSFFELKSLFQQISQPVQS